MAARQSTFSTRHMRTFRTPTGLWHVLRADPQMGRSLIAACPCFFVEQRRVLAGVRGATEWWASAMKVCTNPLLIDPWP